jgi:hypothetical protein
MPSFKDVKTSISLVTGELPSRGGAGTACRCELGYEQRIAGAAAGDDELVDFGFGEHVAVQGIHYRERGEDGGGAD